MKVKTNLIIQVCGFTASIATALSGSVPLKYKAIAIGVASLAQGISAWVAHYYNPDGTPILP